MPTLSTQNALEALTHGAADRIHGIIEARIQSAYYMGKEDAVAVVELLRTVCHQAVWTAPEPLAQHLSYVLKITDPQHADQDTAAAIRTEIMAILDKYTPKDNQCATSPSTAADNNPSPTSPPTPPSAPIADS